MLSPEGIFRQPGMSHPGHLWPLERSRFESCSVSLGKLLNLSEPRFPHLYNEDSSWTTSQGGCEHGPSQTLKNGSRYYACKTETLRTVKDFFSLRIIYEFILQSLQRELIAPGIHFCTGRSLVMEETGEVHERPRDSFAQGSQSAKGGVLF